MTLAAGRPLRIAVVSSTHLPSAGADTEVIVNTAAALGRAGAEVTLVVPWLWRRRRLEEICGFYGVKPTFRLAPLLVWPLPSRALPAEQLFHGLFAGLHPAVRRADVVHSREPLPLLAAHLTGRPWSFETYRRHAQEKPWLPALLRRARLHRALGATAHSEASRADLIALGFPAEAVVTARPGFSLERFEPHLSREEARRQTGLPGDAPIVAYAGNIHASKGMEQLLELARRLPGVRFVIVGGRPGDVRALAADITGLGLGNLTLVGHRRPSEVAPYLFAADALFAPHLQFNIRAGWLEERFGSRVLPGTPLKLYSYLAAGRAIVGADQPINRELLRHEENALLFPADRLDVAADAVRRILADPALAARLGERGRASAAGFTWERRAEVMLSFFERRLAERRR